MLTSHLQRDGKKPHPPAVASGLRDCTVAASLSNHWKRYEELSTYPHITVHIAGRCAKNESLRNICPYGDSCEHIFKRYYFYFATENSQCTDYISEKLWARLHLPLIPIVIRRSLYDGHAPRNSFIALDDHETPEDLADYLKYLVGNRTAYMQYFAWRNASPMRVWSTEGFTTVFCNLCRTFSMSDDRPRRPVIPSIADWFTAHTHCDYDSFDVAAWSLKSRSE
ncbi:FUT-3 protein [Aphelenchoides avenae]|nr:FUT-3 protein [Aphelenchus avenae]